jgi:hypothetical protein
MKQSFTPLLVLLLMLPISAHARCWYVADSSASFTTIQCKSSETIHTLSIHKDKDGFAVYKKNGKEWRRGWEGLRKASESLCGCQD